MRTLSEVMRTFLLVAGITLFLSAGLAAAEEDEALAGREAFFHALVPGVTEEAIVAAVGITDTEQDGKPAYRMPRGTVVVGVDLGRVTSCIHYLPGCCQSTALYHAPPLLPPRDKDRALPAIEERIATRAFAGAVDLGPGYTTSRHPGARCYLLRDGYLAVEKVAPLFGASGAFEHLIARATVFRGPSFEPEVVWRLADHWPEARPAALADAELDRREAVLRRHRAGIPDGSLRAMLGEPDGRMGSGVPYGLYYLRDGLLTIVLLDGWTGSVELSQPGADRQTTVEEWLEK
jgi:hypothetical protein